MNIMKVFLRILMSLSFLVSLAIVLYVIILSQNSIKGAAFGLLINVLLFILIGISIYGISKGNIVILKFRRRLGSVVLFTVSIFFLIYVSALGVLNIFLEKNSKEEVPSLKESVLAVENVFIPIAYKEGLLTKEFGGITYRFPEGEETSIHTLKSLYPIAKEELDKIYGEDSSVDLTIIMYKNTNELNSQLNMEQVSGFYVPSNQSIHLVSEKQMGLNAFQDSFIHEYTHYRTDQYFKKYHISSRSIPQWFNEGISEFEMNLHTNVDIDLKKVINFTDIDTNDNFHKARHDDFDPYHQSYFAVKELVLEHGMNVIPKLITASKDSNFYSVFQKITGTKIEEFQSKFLNRREKIKKLVKQADEVEKKKQYKNAENLYLEIARLDPYDISPDQNLPYLYIKQMEFEKAMNKLKESDYPDLEMMSEISLLTSLEESLKYAEMAEEEIRKNSGNVHYKSKFAEAIRKNLSEPAVVYKKLFAEDLIIYKEIETELFKKLR
ncbi:hypothetical protein G6549_26865 [Bacillus sp. MM2020_1]|nr:hypothetical protein [Bacillus sp. MM2020_1]